MRVLFAIFLLLSVGIPVQAQAPSRFAFISVPEAEVRAGRSLDPAMYPTNRLRQGTTIEVVDEKDNWVGIKPPPGSFSWVDMSKLNPVAGSTTNYVVTGPAGTKSVQTLIGSAFNGEKMPTVEGVSLPRGSQVTSIYQPLKDGDKLWLKIEPPEGEVRWVPRQAVGGLPTAPSAPPTGTGAYLAPGVLTSNGSQVAPIAPLNTPGIPNPSNPNMGAPPPPVVSGVAPLERWNMALKAESAGQTLEALRIYNEMSQDLAATDPAWANSASARAQRLRNQGMVQGYPAPQNMPAYSPCMPQAGYPYTPWVPLVPIPYAGGYYPQQQPVQFNQPIGPPLGPPIGGPPVNGQVNGGPANGRIAGSGLPKGQGYLRKSGRFVDKRPLYLLETIEGRPIYYLLPTQGISFEPWLDHRVEVSGGTFYNPETRAEILYVQQIRMVPQ